MWRTRRFPIAGDPGDSMNDSLNRDLIAAAWRNDVEEATRLIEQGADVNATDETVQSAYLIATSEGFNSLLALTLQHGADVSARDSYNGTGLIRAAERGHAFTVGMAVPGGGKEVGRRILGRRGRDDGSKRGGDRLEPARGRVIQGADAVVLRGKCGVGTARQQYPDGVGIPCPAVTEHDRFEQRGPSQVVDVVDLDPGADEHADRECVTPFRGADESCPVVAVQ